MLFKLSNLNSNLTLTLGYLNPALNNSARENNESLQFWGLKLVSFLMSLPLVFSRIVSSSFWIVSSLSFRVNFNPKSFCRNESSTWLAVWVFLILFAFSLSIVFFFYRNPVLWNLLIQLVVKVYLKYTTFGHLKSTLEVYFTRTVLWVYFQDWVYLEYTSNILHA